MKANYSNLAMAILILALLAVMSTLAVHPAIATGNISIKSDADFQTCGCVSGGTGTASDPFILSGLTLVTQAAPGILVDNSAGKITKFFNIVGDTITGGAGPPTNFPGIEFVNVNGLGEITGSTNTFNGNQYGILLLGSSHILIDGVSTSTGATVNGNGIAGIAIVGGGSNTISNIRANKNGVAIPETFLGGGKGISLNSTTGNTISNVQLNEDSVFALALFSSSNNLVSGVSALYADFYAAVVDGGSGNTLKNNQFQSANFVGLWLRSSASNNQILSNTIAVNGPIGNEITAAIVPYFTTGLYISSGASNNAVKNNNFFSNTGGSVVLDNGNIVNPVTSPIQSNNPFNDPVTGNEPAKKQDRVPPSGPAGNSNTFCGNSIFTTQPANLSNPPCT